MTSAPTTPRPSSADSARDRPHGQRQPASERPAPIAHLSSDMRVAVARLNRRLRAEKPDNELSSGQFSALATIFREGPLTLRELSDLERVTPPSMIRTVAVLVDDGYVSKEASERDGRMVMLTVTERGLDLIKATRQRRDAWLARRLVKLTPHQRKVLAEATAIMRELADS